MKRLLIVALTLVGLCVVTQPTALHAQAKSKPKVLSATGLVKSISGSSITITSGSKDMSFTIDAETKFVGKGLSTKKAQQGKLTATDAVGVNDRVAVSYHDMGGTMHAASVNILSKSPMKK